MKKSTEILKKLEIGQNALKGNEPKYTEVVLKNKVSKLTTTKFSDYELLVSEFLTDIRKNCPKDWEELSEEALEKLYQHSLHNVHIKSTLTQTEEIGELLRHLIILYIREPQGNLIDSTEHNKYRFMAEVVLNQIETSDTTLLRVAMVTMLTYDSDPVLELFKTTWSVNAKKFTDVEPLETWILHAFSYDASRILNYLGSLENAPTDLSNATIETFGETLTCIQLYRRKQEELNQSYETGLALLQKAYYLVNDKEQIATFYTEADELADSLNEFGHAWKQMHAKLGEAHDLAITILQECSDIVSDEIKQKYQDAGSRREEYFKEFMGYLPSELRNLYVQKQAELKQQIYNNDIIKQLIHDKDLESKLALKEDILNYQKSILQYMKKTYTMTSPLVD